MQSTPSSASAILSFVLVALTELASHRDDPQYVAFAFTLAGVCGFGYFAAKAWAKLTSSDPPTAGWLMVAGGFVLSALLLGGGTYVIAELETPLVAARVLAATVVLPAGILLAFIVAMAVGMAGNELLGYGIGAVILVLMGVALWLLLPGAY